MLQPSIDGSQTPSLFTPLYNKSNPPSKTHPSPPCPHPPPPLSLGPILPHHQRLRLLEKIPPRLNQPHEPTRHPPPKQQANPPIRPDRHQLRRGLTLLMNLLRSGPGRRQIDEDGARERRDGVVHVENTAERIRRDVADGIDAARAGGRSAERLAVRGDVAARRQPRRGEESGIGLAAGGVDEEVDALRAAIGEFETGAARCCVEGGGGGEAQVVRDGDAEAGEVGGGVAAGAGGQAVEQAGGAGEQGDGFGAAVLGGEFAGGLDAGGAAADDGDGVGGGEAQEEVFEGGARGEVGAVEGPEGGGGGGAGCEDEGVVGGGGGLAGFGEGDGDGFLVVVEAGGLALDEVEAV